MVENVPWSVPYQRDASDPMYPTATGYAGNFWPPSRDSSSRRKVSPEVMVSACLRPPPPPGLPSNSAMAETPPRESSRTRLKPRCGGLPGRFTSAGRNSPTHKKLILSGPVPPPFA